MKFTKPWQDWREGHGELCGLWVDPVKYDCSCGETQRRGAIVRALIADSTSSASEEDADGRS